MEDADITLVNIVEGVHLFAVFDGHGGNLPVMQGSRFQSLLPNSLWTSSRIMKTFRRASTPLLLYKTSKGWTTCLNQPPGNKN